MLRDDTLTVVARRPDPQYFYEEFIEARFHFDGPGTYQIPEGKASFSQITGGDAGYRFYGAGTVTIEAYDPRRQVIRGELNLIGMPKTAAESRWAAHGRFTGPVSSRAPSIR